MEALQRFKGGEEGGERERTRDLGVGGVGREAGGGREGGGGEMEMDGEGEGEEEAFGDFTLRL